MRRKEERSKKVKQTNKAKQHSTPEAVTFPKKNDVYTCGLVKYYLHVLSLFCFCVCCRCGIQHCASDTGQCDCEIRDMVLNKNK